MREFEIILGLALVATLIQPIARRFDVPLAIALRDEEIIGDAAFRKVISDLDLDEIRNVDEPII